MKKEIEKIESRLRDIEEIQQILERLMNSDLITKDFYLTPKMARLLEKKNFQEGTWEYFRADANKEILEREMYIHRSQSSTYCATLEEEQGRLLISRDRFVKALESEEHLPAIHSYMRLLDGFLTHLKDTGLVSTKKVTCTAYRNYLFHHKGDLVVKVVKVLSMDKHLEINVHDSNLLRKSSLKVLPVVEKFIEDMPYKDQVKDEAPSLWDAALATVSLTRNRNKLVSQLGLDTCYKLSDIRPRGQRISNMPVLSDRHIGRHYWDIE